MIQKLLMAFIIVSSLMGCAGIISGTSQSVTFTSEPSGAEVLIDGQLRGVTPLVVRLKKSKYDSVMIKKKGFKTVVRPIEKSYDTVAFLNIFWDLSTTDMISGAAYEYEPNSYYIKLQKSTAE